MTRPSDIRPAVHFFSSSSPLPRPLPQDDEENEGPDADAGMDRAGNGNGAAPRKALRSDDPTFKSAEQLR